MNRQQHMQWCKDRALELLRRGDLKQAVLSMASDLRKHEDTVGLLDGPVMAALTLNAMQEAGQNNKKAVEDYITGFN